MGALIPLALSIAPELGRWLFGATAAKTTEAVVKAVQAVTGTADAEAARAVLQRDPAGAAALRVQLAQVAAELDGDARAMELASLTAVLRDSADARRQLIALSSEKAAVAWSAPVMSAAVLLTFGGVMLLVVTRGVPAGSETVSNLLLGTLATMATSVVSYWVGSSAGSARKEERLAQASRPGG